MGFFSIGLFLRKRGRKGLGYICLVFFKWFGWNEGGVS